jgi:hypothetical protein
MNWTFSIWGILGGMVYFLAFVISLLFIEKRLHKRRGERPPVAFKLLRAPGETLRRDVLKLDEDFFLQALWASSMPLAVAALALNAAKAVEGNVRTAVLVVSLPLFCTSIFLSARWLIKKLQERRNRLIGYLGERAVAEQLVPLHRDGFQIFHDFPAEANDRKFNIDHVVVGPTGVFAIETKTRRKGRAREGFKEHEVTFDGQKLIWPWAEDTHGINQAQSQARWLTELLTKLTGIDLEVKPILALPGWYVKAVARGAVNVVNAKGLPSAIKGRGQRVLTDEQVDLLARQIEERCRDVED